jgi:hypothetical protein
MSLHVTLELSGLSAEQLDGLAGAMKDRSGIHARMAGDGEIFLKQAGSRIAAGQHRTARTLGAQETGHLARAYEGIEGVSSADAGTLLIPRASRLRAAFGSYVLTPQNGSDFLTIPVHPAAYGRRAREFEDLFPVQVGPQRTLVLARHTEEGLETMYVLVTKATIPEDPTLIPFAELAAAARDSAEAYLDDLIERSLA